MLIFIDSVINVSAVCRLLQKCCFFTLVGPSTKQWRMLTAFNNLLYILITNLVTKHDQIWSD